MDTIQNLLIVLLILWNFYIVYTGNQALRQVQTVINRNRRR